MWLQRDITSMYGIPLLFQIKSFLQKTLIEEFLQPELNTGTFYVYRVAPSHRIKISNRRATQRCNVSAFFYAKICSLLARRRSSQPVQRVYWPGHVIDWLGKWRPTCVMREDRNFKASDVSGPSIWIFIL